MDASNKEDLASSQTSSFSISLLISPISAVTKAVLGLFIVLNYISGIIPTIWLLIIGGWRIVLIGIFISISSSFLTSIFIFLSLRLSAPFAKLTEKTIIKGKSLLVAFYYFLSQIFPSAIIVIWCLVIMDVFIRFTNQYTIYPVMLFSYIVALAPWMYHILKDEENLSGNMIAILANTSYLASVIALFLGVHFDHVILIFIAIFLVGQILVSNSIRREIKNTSPLRNYLRQYK